MKRQSDEALRGGALEVAESLRRSADQAGRKAAALGRPVLAWATSKIPQVDPLDVFERFGAIAGDRVLWTRPGERFGVVGLGSAWAVNPDGVGRFARAGAGWRACLEHAVGDQTPRPDWGTGLLALGGFAFSPDGPTRSEWEGFPAASLAVPRLCVSSISGASALTLAIMVAPGARTRVDEQIAAALHRLVGVSAIAPTAGQQSANTTAIEEIPSGEEWRAMVESAARAAGDGLLRKIVLARGVKIRGVSTHAAGALRRLRDDYPACAVFAVTRGGGCFLGATPERLVRVRAGQVSAIALAGSAARGRTPDEDARLGEALVRSPKDRLEHAVVVDVLRDVFAEVCDDVPAAVAPSLLRLANIQHLLTPLEGRLRERLTILELIERLHPTPAVGGFPRDGALRWMQEHEDLDRGWYAGPVGWINQEGEGEFAVAIRSALLRGGEALLFAGCGIVAQSDPDQEYAESWLKLRPMLSALGIERAAGLPVTGTPAAGAPAEATPSGALPAGRPEP